MKNLNLWVGKELIRSIPRKDIGIEVNFNSITEKFISNASKHEWIVSVNPPSGNDVTTDIFFKDKDTVGYAYLLWGYLLKQELKKIL